jgi:hypothetical protein
MAPDAFLLIKIRTGGGVGAAGGKLSRLSWLLLLDRLLFQRADGTDRRGRRERTAGQQQAHQQQQG